MTNHVQTLENNERLKRYFTALERMSGAMEKLFSLKKPSIAGESFYTDRDLSEKLKISRRSLQDYRNISLFSLVFILFFSAYLSQHLSRISNVLLGGFV